jgi:hypothetical protein
MSNINTFLESTKIVRIPEPAWDPLIHYQKNWLPGDQPFEPTEKGAKFFQWASPGKKVEFLVPWDAMYTTNRLPTNLHNDGTYPEFEIPHGELPEGMKLVDSLDVAGKLKLVPVGQDARSTEQRLADIEGKIDLLLKRGA